MQARHRLQQVQSMGMYQTMVPWLPVAVGIGIMVGFVVYAVTLQSASQPAFDAPAGAAPTYPPASAAAPPPPPAAATDPPVETPEPLPPPPEPPPPPPPDVTGKYVLTELFGDSFVAKVVIVNESHDQQHWKVTLEYPDSVAELVEFWVDGAQQPELDRSHDAFVFTSAEPVDARSHVVLKVHFERDGADVTPEVCEVNGAHCRL